MSAISLIFNRDASPIHEAAFAASLNRLHYWGLDGCDSWIGLGIAIGHQHNLVTREEQNERQPLITDDYVIAFVGRIDNRDELIRALGLDPADGAALSDAALILRGYRAWGQGVFARLLGGFIVVIYDRAAHSITLARDALGDVGLYYVLDHHRLIAASEPQALFAHPNVPSDLNEQSMLRWFAVKMPLAGETRFAAIRDLPAATILTISADEVRETRYWEPKITQVRYRTNDEYAEHFREQLDLAVQRCLRCAEPPVVLMSGGYDSTSIAALTAQRMPLRTVSWGFDTLPESDERAYIKSLVNHYDADATYVLGDDANPFEEVSAPIDLNTPDPSPYRVLQRRIYRAAVQKGARVALAGWFGNHLYVGGNEWLTEYLKDGRLRDFAAGAKRLIRDKGVIGGLTSESMNRARRYAVKRLTGIARFRRISKTPAWMLLEAAQALITDQLTVPAGLRADQFSAMLASDQAYSASYMQVYGAQMGLRLAAPYRDRQLIEFVLGIPADQLFDGARHKAIMFRAMEGILPEMIRQRRDFPVQLPLYLSSVRQSAPKLRALLSAPDAIWRRYVKEQSVLGVIDAPHTVSGGEVLQPWMAYTMQNWLRQIGEPLVK